jgi:hypothetical protein
MDVRLIQTSDPVRYRPLFDITAEACRALCARHALTYAPFIGVVRGHFPWHAVYNRIFLLNDLAEAGFGGWVIYLDADAYPFDLSFNVRRYLAANRSVGMIAASGGPEPWQPNSGMLLLNFADFRMRSLLAAWHAQFLAYYPGGMPRAEPDWPQDVEGDQAMLHHVLRKRNDLATLLKDEPRSLMFDVQSTFLRQVTRSFGSFRERCEEARTGVQVALRMGKIWT